MRTSARRCPTRSRTTGLGDINENLIINELIREYLVFNGYRSTLVMLPGSQPDTPPFDRDFLARSWVRENENSRSSSTLPIQRAGQQVRRRCVVARSVVSNTIDK